MSCHSRCTQLCPLILPPLSLVGGGMPADSEGTRGCFAGGGAESPGGQREGVPGFTSALRERFPKVNTGRSLPGKREA